MAGHVFLSYSHADRAYADRLAGYLTAAGVPVWYDVEVETGEPFGRAIQQAIDDCAAFVVVLTPTSVASGWVLRELSRAVRKGKPLHPLLCAPCDTPLELDGVQHEEVVDGRMPGPRFVARLRDRPTPAVPAVCPGFPGAGLGGSSRCGEVRRGASGCGGPGVDPRLYAFLRGSFLDVVPRSPSLFECRDVRAARGVPCGHTRRRHIVHVAAHVGGEEESTVPVGTDDVRGWLEAVEGQPAVLLVGRPRRSGHLTLRMLCLHEWLLREAARGPAWIGVGDLPLAAFRPVGGHGAVFHRTVLREVDRVTGSDDGVWRTSKDSGLLPVDETTLLEFLEFARFLEVPQPVFERLVALGDPTEVVVACLRRSWSSSDPVVDAWLADIRELSRAEPAGVARRQFRHFTRFLERHGRGVGLPRYSSRHTAYWRVFTAMYPDALRGIAHVLRTSTSANDVVFTASLLSTLTLSNDRVVSSRAGAVLRELATRRQDFPQYYARREILRSLAEGGERGWLPAVIDLVATEGADGEEQRYLNAYGWTADVVEAKIRRRLDYPTLRNQQMREHLEVMAEITCGQRGVRGRVY